MPADLSQNQQGEYEFAYQGDELPWHGLGFPVERNITPKQMLKAARLNWRVAMGQVQFSHPERGLIVDSQHQVMYREDSGAVLDITGPKYTPFQNEEVLYFFKEYVEAGEMTLETAGALNGGRQIWALARMEQGFTLPGKDRVEGYVLLMNPHQYGKGGILKFTPVRVVCANTMAMALGSGDAGIKLWHNRPFDEDMQNEAKRRLGIARERLDAYGEVARELSQWTMTAEDVLTALQPQFNADPEKEIEEQSPTVLRLIELWSGAGMGATLKAADHTAWGLLNAATQYFDHEYGKTRDARMTNAWLGTGSVKKRELMNTLLQQGRDARAAA